MVEVNWTLQALQDIESISEYISRDSVKYAKIQASRFFEVVEILEEFPKTGRIVPELNKTNIRELILGNYRIVYKIISLKSIDILAIHHSARAFVIKKKK
jgi:toxin ParE1/3/4